MEETTKFVNYYSRFLSPVGSRILDFMIKDNKQKQFESKVLIFNKDDENSKNITDMHFYQKKSVNPLTITNSSTSDMISCTNEVDSCDVIVHNENNSSEIKLCTLSVPSKELAENANTHNERKSTPSWDNMFDPELFLIHLEDNNMNNIGSNVPNKRDSVDKHPLVNENQLIHLNEKDVCEIKTTTKQLKKRKSSQGLITNVISKKVKNNIPSESKVRNQNTCRNPKYIKPVQNWLENIESNTKNFNTQSLSEQIPKQKENSLRKKKTIQTCLINKNGVMKYTRNKSVTEKGTLHKNDDQVQLPLDTIIIDESNIHKLMKNTLGKYQEIILLLINGDGCSQLESEQKHLSSTPDGLFLQLCSNSYSQYYLRSERSSFTGVTKKFLKQIINEAEVVCYNAKDILKYLAQWLNLQYDLDNVKFLDIKTGVTLLRADDPPDSFAAAVTMLGVQNVSADVDAGAVASMLRSAAAALRTALTVEGLEKLFYNIEMPIVPIIAGMEMRGIEINMEKLKEMQSTLLLELNAAESACHAAAGHEFLVTSTAQVRTVLYEELRLHMCLPTARFFDTNDTSENTLKKLSTVHPLPNLILEFRKLHKIQATFISGLIQHVKDGIVTPEWMQTAATTGRIACRGPNLQAVPKVQKLRAVLVARHDHLLLAADFQQMECRVFATLAADEKLMDLLTAPGDFFRLLAAQWLGRTESDVTAEERERTKRIVYASLYGAGVRSLAEMLHATYDRTLQFLTSFNRSFPSLRKFGEDAVRRCEAAGGTLSLPSGRRRRLPAIVGCDAVERAHAQRQAINFLVQGTAADLCKVAMERVATALRMARLDAPLLLQVHDELIWEVPEQHLHSVAEIVRHKMEGCGQALGLRLGLPVALSYGPNWGDMIAL